MELIKRAFGVLDLFLDKQEPMGVSQVAKIVNINPTTTYRIMSALVKCGYLEQLNKRGKYFISTKKLMSLSGVVTPSLKIRYIAFSFLWELSTKVHEITQIAIRIGNVAFKDDVMYSDNMLNLPPSREKIVDLHSTGTGKIFLAEMSDPEFQDYCQNITIRPLTPNTITDQSKLKEHLKKVKEDGIAYDFEEHELGVDCVAVPVKDSDGNVVAAIGIIVPPIRVNSQKISTFSRTLKIYANKVSRAIKY